MSRYASELAHARLDALRTLLGALNQAETPDEKRRCAVAIFNAPDPCDLDDEIEPVDDDEDEKENQSENKDDDCDDENHVTQHHDTDNLEDDDRDNPEPTATPQPAPASLTAQSVGCCHVAAASPQHSPLPTLPHTPHPQSPTLFLPAPSGPAARLIAAAGRSP